MNNENNNGQNEAAEENKASVTLTGTVDKIIQPPIPQMPEKAQISVEGAEELYKEIRVDNKVVDEEGNERKLKPGAKVEVTIQADPKDTEKKADS